MRSCPSCFLALLTLLAPLAIAADKPPAEEPIDWPRARTLHQREQRGEKLSPEERAYLDRARAERQKGGARGAGKNPVGGRESTDLVPLTQLKEKYKGFDGGLYGSGSNELPDAHRKAALSAAAKIVPLDKDGKPAADGKIVLMSMGMSNTTQEFSRFKRIANLDAEINPSLLIVDAAQGGKDAAAWTSGAAGGEKPGNAVWDTADQRITQSGATPRQVQVIWIKQALAGPARYGDFPKHAEALRDHVRTAIQIAHLRYPNLKLVYLSSRIYAGYAGSQLNPEPYAYEGAFAMRWVIEDQIKGDQKLNHDPVKGDMKAPVVLWGPYLWANGVKGRELDDLTYQRDDLAGDGTHPSQSGQQKVAQTLLKFFKTDQTTRGWFLKG